MIHVDLVRHAEQEEVDQPWDVCLAALALDDLDDLVVRRGVELDEYFADHADPRLRAVVSQGKRIEGLNRVLAKLVETRAIRMREDCLGSSHEALIQALCRALPRLVRARAIQQLHDHIPINQAVEGMQQDVRRQHVKARVVLIKAKGG